VPDPALSEALAEAGALAPADEIFRETLEFRHDDFEDENGDPDSLWLVADTQDLVAPLEADAPIKPGQWVTFRKSAFSGALRHSIEPGATPEIEITVNGVSRAILEYLDLAAASAKPLTVAYRIYLDTALEDGPQRDPVDVFEVADIQVGVSTITIKARTRCDLRGAFPVRVFGITEFPGLAGR
jgi:hypothetical protein